MPLRRPDKLIRRLVPLAQVVKRGDNPNAITKREFDLRVRNSEQLGWTEPMLRRPLPGDDEKWEIIGGHHRYDTGVFLGFTEGPATIITDPAFSQEMADLQVMRMNVIKGKLNPQSFFKLYRSTPPSTAMKSSRT